MSSSTRSSLSSPVELVKSGTKRASQMTTSTPQKRNRRSLINEEDFDISSVTRAESETTSVSDISDTMTESFVYEVDDLHITKIDVKTKEFAFYCPKKKQRLFAKLLQNYDRVEDIAITWMNMYNQRAADAKLTLLQLIVDVMGFENVNVENEFISHNISNFVKILTLKAATQPKCILNSRTKFGKNFTNIFFMLFKHLIYLGYKNHYLYDIFQDIIGLCTFLSQSNKRVLTFTSTVIATKLCTEFLKVRKDVAHAVVSEFELNESDNEIRHNLTILNDIVLAFMTIYNRNCCLYDTKLFYLREICAEEMQRWIKICPEQFINNEQLKLIGNLVVDENRYVRVAALKTVLYIVKNHTFTKFTSNCKNIMQQLFDALKKTLTVTIDDVDTRRLIIRIFTHCIENYKEIVNNEIRSYIVQRIYAKDYRVAKESGRFYNTYIKIFTLKNELDGVMFMAKYPQRRGRADVVVETLFETTESLKNFGDIISILKEESMFNYEDRILLFEILYNIVYIVLNGRGTFFRANVTIDVNCRDNSDKVVTNIIPNLHILLDVYDDSDEAIQNLLKTVLLINFNESSHNRYRSHMVNAMNEMLLIIKSTVNQDIISLISQVFAKLYDRNCPFHGIASSHFSIYIDIIVTDYKENYFQLQEAVTEEQLKAVLSDLKPLSIIMEHQNCNNNLEWDDIFVKWELVDMHHVIEKSQMKCCLWFLIWEIRNLLNGDIEDIEQRVQNLQTHINDYLNSLIFVLKNSNVTLLQITAFDCISDLCRKFNKLYIEENIQNNDHLKTVEINLQKLSRTSDILTQFMTKICFQEETVTLATRKRILANFVALLCLKQIDRIKISNVLKHYLLFQHEYQGIFDLLIHQLGNEGLIKAVILTYVLAHVYLETKNITETKKLTQAFSAFLSKELLRAATHMAINFVSNSRNNIPFLCCAAVLAEKISTEDKKYLVELIQSKFAPVYFHHDEVHNFLKFLKRKTTQGTTTASRSVRSPCASPTSSRHSPRTSRHSRPSRVPNLGRVEEEDLQE